MNLMPASAVEDQMMRRTRVDMTAKNQATIDILGVTWLPFQLDRHTVVVTVLVSYQAAEVILSVDFIEKYKHTDRFPVRNKFCV